MLEHTDRNLKRGTSAQRRSCAHRVVGIIAPTASRHVAGRLRRLTGGFRPEERVRKREMIATRLVYRQVTRLIQIDQPPVPPLVFPPATPSLYPESPPSPLPFFLRRIRRKMRRKHISTNRACQVGAIYPLRVRASVRVRARARACARACASWYF